MYTGPSLTQLGGQHIYICAIYRAAQGAARLNLSTRCACAKPPAGGPVWWPFGVAFGGGLISCLVVVWYVFGTCLVLPCLVAVWRLFAGSVAPNS